MRSARTTCTFALVSTFFLVLAGCEKPTHENIDKWRRTQRGPSKLISALGDGSLEVDLRAHAAQALVSIDKTDEVVKAFEKMKEPERAAVLDKLAPRLWDDCKLSDELAVPTDKQVAAKDALFTLRAMAKDPQRDQIDGYLLDWLTGFYEGRALKGLHQGDVIVRALGARAAPKLVAAARAILNDPGEGNKIPVLGDELLKGLAWSGAPEAISLLLDIAENDHPDDSLKIRAMGALYHVFILNQEPPRANPAVLRPLIPRLQAIAAAPAPVPQPGENINVAFELIAATGKPHCIAPLVALAAHDEEPRRWQALQKGLACAGAEGVVPMAEALPQQIEYPRGIMEKYFWDKIVEIGPDKVAGPARTLLGSSNWVAKLTGIEVLARVGTAKDTGALRAIKDNRRAKGWWKAEDEPKARKKKEPTLASLAADAAIALEQKR